MRVTVGAVGCLNSKCTAELERNSDEFPEDDLGRAGRVHLDRTEWRGVDVRGAVSPLYDAFHAIRGEFKRLGRTPLIT
jgi:hypothetical protein